MTFQPFDLDGAERRWREAYELAPLGAAVVVAHVVQVEYPAALAEIRRLRSVVTQMQQAIDRMGDGIEPFPGEDDDG